jgi:rubrerythrin
MPDFNAREIIEVAIEMEKNGEAFYKVLSENTDGAEVKSLFKHLAEEESEHAKDFKEILGSLFDNDDSSRYELNEAAASYFRAFAKTQVFKNIEEAKKIASQFDTVEEAVSYAIGIEVKTIAFYRELSTTIDKGTDKIEDLIKQEHGHVARLFSLID